MKNLDFRRYKGDCYTDFVIVIFNLCIGIGFRKEKLEYRTSLLFNFYFKRKE